MTLHHVHIYREVMQLFRNVEADTPEEAARIAADLPPQDASFSEDCDGETFAALVDVVGDDEYSLSLTIDFEAGRVLRDGQRQLAALRAIAADPDACTCHTRSWHGEGHDTQCPIRIAREAAGDDINQPISQEEL